MTPKDDALDWENIVVLSVVQALLGVMTPAIRGVSVSCNATSVTIFFAIDLSLGDVAEDLDDVMVEFENYLVPRSNLEPPNLQIYREAYPGSPYYGWPGKPMRMVYLEKYTEPETR